MSIPHKCPVCDGEGVLPNGEQDCWPRWKPCIACDCTRIVWESMAEVELPVKPSRCPPSVRVAGDNGPPPPIEQRPDPPPAPPSPCKMELDDIHRRLKELETEAVLRDITRPAMEIKGDIPSRSGRA